jgi:ATP-dependent DNA helicase RecG
MIFHKKNIIAFGLIAQHKKLLSTELDKLLQLDDNKKMRSYVDGLLNLGIIITRGIKKGNEFLVNPQIIVNSKTNIKTSLKTIEPHRLMALIEEDLRFHPKSTRREIHQRLPDVSEKDMKKYLYEMTNAGKLCTEGGKTFRRYELA